MTRSAANGTTCSVRRDRGGPPPASGSTAAATARTRNPEPALRRSADRRRGEQEVAQGHALVLGEDGGGAGLEERLAHGWTVGGREADDAQLRTPSPNLGGRLDAVHARHRPVPDDDVGRQLVDRREAVLGGGGLADDDHVG